MNTDSLRRIPSVIRFGGHVGWERVRAPRPTTLSTVPASAEALTPEWMTELLCDEVAEAEVVRIDVVGGHDGSTSRRAVTLTYNPAGQEAGLPEHLFTKSLPKLRQRLTLVSTGKLVAETGFYNSVRPMLDIEATAALYAAFDERSGRSMQVFEDLVATAGARFLNPFSYIERHQAEDMVGLMAGYHGTMWRHRSLRTFPWLRTTLAWQQTVNRAIPFEHCSYTGIERADAVLPVALKNRNAELWDAHMRSLELSARPPHTLLHNDMHIGNWYLTGDGRMGLSDWGMYKGLWANDFSYALSSALTIDDRREWERDLVSLFVDELHKRGGPSLSFDDAWLAYRQQMWHGLFYWLMTLGVGALQADMQPDDISLVNIERMAQAVVDLESLKAVDG